MIRAAGSLLLGVALGCRSHAAVDSAVARGGAEPGVAAANGGGSTGPACAPEAPGIPRLETFLGAEMGKRYWLEMTSAGDQWQPEPIIVPSYHHRSRLDLDNLDDFPELVAARGRRMRFTVELTSSDVSKIPDRYEWRSVYHARIVQVCELREQ